MLDLAQHDLDIKTSGKPCPLCIFTALYIFGVWLPVNMPLVHVSRVFHLFFISPILIIIEIRACRQALENTFPIYLIWYIVFLLLNCNLIDR